MYVKKDLIDIGLDISVDKQWTVGVHAR